MKSYASVDRLEGKLAVCEVELVDLEQSKKMHFANKPTAMMSFALGSSFSNIRSGDILIVKHNKKQIQNVLCKDDAEKQRRKAIVSAIISRI